MKSLLVVIAVFAILMFSSCAPARVGVSVGPRPYYGARPYYAPRPYYNPYYYGRGRTWGYPHHRSYYHHY